MHDSKSDVIAREAARLLHNGNAGSVDEAIHNAAEALGAGNGDSRPGRGRVRKHAQAMAMQELGDLGYAESVRRVLETAERFMTALEESLTDVRTVLAGRAAEAHIDGGVTLYVRAYTTSPINELAQLLVDLGYDEPGFETAETRHGRLDRMTLEDDGLEIVLTRCPPQLESEAKKDLFSGQRIATLTLEELRRMIAR